MSTMGKMAKDSFKIEGYTVFKSKKSGYYCIRLKKDVERSLKTKDKSTARARAKEVVKQIHLKKVAALSKIDRITITDYIDEYIEARDDLSDETTRMDRIALTLLSQSIGEKTLMALIDESSIEKFKKDCKGRKVKPLSINTYLRHIRSALNTARKSGYMRKPVEIKFLKTGERLPRILTKKEREAVLEYAKKHDYTTWRFAVFCLYTGCRRCEVKDAKWQHYDRGLLLIKGKGDKDRYIPILDEALEGMGKQQDIGPIFPQWHINTYTKKFKKIAVECGIYDISLHKLRHSAGTAMVESGIDLETVKEILGHADIKTTEIYVHLSNQHKKKQMKKLKY